MKGFCRENQLLSLCGINCGLCPMLLSGHCGGCGNGNQSCTIARCSLSHGAVAYCFECEEYPCEKYQHIDEFDSFITHRHQRLDFEKAQRIGIVAYNLEQEEKVKILDHLLSHYNDGRKKTFFCVAVNLLDLDELREALGQIEEHNGQSSLSAKEKTAYVVTALQRMADKRNIQLKLRKKQ